MTEVETLFEQSGSESNDSLLSGSYEEEDLYSSESEIVTQFNSKTQSKVNFENVGPSLSDLSLDLLLDDALTESESGEEGKQTATQLSKQELIRQVHLRRHINQLKKILEEKEIKVEDSRVKLLHCREHLNSLLTRESSLQTKISELEGDGGKAPSLGLIRSQLDKVRVELESERKVELNIQNELQKAEVEWCEAKAAMEKFEDAETDLVREEEAAKEVKMRQAVKRLRAENQLAINAERTKKAQERLLSDTLRDQEAQTRLLMKQARLAQEKGKQFLQESADKRKREKAEVDEQHRAHLDRRVKAMISLKKNIESSQGTIQAQQMLKSESTKQKQAQEQREREKIQSEGGNPDEVLLRKQRVESFGLSKEAFLKKQSERQVEIINKLLEEEKMLKKAEEKLSKSHWYGKQQCPHPSKRLSSKKPRRVKSLQRHSATSPDKASPIDKAVEPITLSERDLSTSPVVHEDTLKEGKVHPEQIAITNKEESLAEPEIRGLWEKGQSSVGMIKRERSKVEEEMMREAMDKLKKSNVIKQVVAGREFKGQAFTSKPTEVVFQDFDVGKTYRKKVVLTNISYSFNYCKLLGVTDNLKDFVTIEFNPPGSMSAGLTCHMLVSFQPKLNEDIYGDIEMLSQTGPFTIPVKCLTKKCLISADKTVVEFGRVCVGETMRKHVTLTNGGALPTKFTFGPKSELPPSLLAPSESGADQSSAGHLSDKSMYSIMSNVEPRPSRMDTLTVGGAEEKVSRSVGDLSCVSQKSISWANNARVEGGATAAIEQSVPTVLSQPSLASYAPCFTVGKVTEGEIAGFSSCTVELVFSPVSPTEQSSEFILTFSHPTVPPMVLTGQGCGVEVPVWLERESMDLRVCMLDRLYQDTVVLHNRAATALRVTFQVPPPLQPHMEVLPKYGVIQGDSSYSAQLKFMPRASILDGSCEQFLTEGGALVMPVEVQVVDQTQPVIFTVTATVTPSELTFDRDSIDFGSCTTHESVVAALHLTNTSLLPQSFGFVSLPAFVDVQPGDGFGEILPEETLAVDVIFSARKPREYSFDLVIKTAIDKTYKIPCHGVGILPALELSQNAINFSATTLNDTSSTSITLHNPRLGRLNSAVIRGALLPQGPKMFEFAVPPGYPITVSPQVGEIPLGESVNVQVQFSPRLDLAEIREEALRLSREELVRQAEEAARLEKERLELEQQLAAKKKGGKKQELKPAAQKSGLLSASKNSLSSSSSRQLVGSQGGSKSNVEAEPPEEGSDLWWQAQHNLLTQFTNSCFQLSIPCFVSSETSSTNLVTPAHRVEDTLYLEVTAPVVRPALVVESECGRTSIDYDSVGTGDSKTKMISIKNISDKHLQLRSSILDPHGPFEVRNALRDLPPGQSANLIVRFSPLTGGKFCEHLVLTYNNTSSLRLKLCGTGVKPNTSLSLDSNILDLGHAMVGDTVTGRVQLTNQSSLSVRYRVTLESSVPGAAEKRRKKGLPFRASNYSGEPPFVCLACEGVISESGGSSELSVLFKPDHQSSAYRDTMLIDINGQHTYTIQLKATAWTNNMFISLPDEPPPDIELSTEESMAATPPLPDDQGPPPTPLVVLFTHHLGSVESGEKLGLQSSSGEGLKKGASKSKANTDSSGVKVSREILIGCIKTVLVKKAASEVSIEGLPSSNPHSKYFSITPLKQSVEAGSTKPVTLSFSPPKDPSLHTVEASTNITLKGDTSQVYRLLLRGLICE